MNTVAQLRTDILKQVWPSGEPENLITVPAGGTKSPYQFLFEEGMAELARWCDNEQTHNIDVIPVLGETKYRFCTTIHPAPQGVIERLWTCLPTDWDDRVYYRMVDWPEPEHLGQQLKVQLSMTADTEPIAVLQGMEDTTDRTDSAYGRGRAGIFCVHNRTITIAPWLQSYELLVIEWRGVKTSWRETDRVNDSQAFRKAMKLWMQYGHARDYGNPAKALMFYNPNTNPKTGLFAEAAADFWWEEREQSKTRDMNLPVNGTLGVITQQLINDGVPQTTEEQVQTITEDDDVDLTVGTSWLSATITDQPSGVNVNLPDGTYARQAHVLAIPANKVATTATFTVSGTFAGGYSVLTFTGLGTSAELLWDGFGWQLLGGNANFS